MYIKLLVLSNLYCTVFSDVFCLVLICSRYLIVKIWQETPLTLSVPETKIAEFANSIDLDEVAHNEL